MSFYTRSGFFKDPGSVLSEDLGLGPGPHFSVFLHLLLRVITSNSYNTFLAKGTAAVINIILIISYKMKKYLLKKQKN